MYLSRVEINTENRKLARELSHLGAYHNWVERSFPDEVDEKVRSRKLWRIDTIGDKRYLLIVSETEPNLERLEHYGVKNSAETKSYEPFLSSIKGGMKFSFRVTLNPVKSVSDENCEKRGRVYPILNEKELVDFLLKRSEKNGFHLNENEFTVVNQGFEVLKKAKETTKLRKSVYEGVLTVSDKERFIETLTKGFGKKKAYGFGMMTVIPID